MSNIVGACQARAAIPAVPWRPAQLIEKGFGCLMVQWAGLDSIPLWWVAPLTLLTFFGTLAAIPLLVVRMPADYFMRPRRRLLDPGERGWLWHLVVVLLKNVLGIVLLTAGLVMLVLPGQGVLTILISLSLLDFPGKYAAERWVIRRSSVFKTVNWIRARAHRPPLQFPVANEDV